jgi:hypothetical protein
LQKRILSDPTIGTCRDADRLDLWRVHLQPDERYMSTERGKELARRFYAKARLVSARFKIPRYFFEHNAEEQQHIGYCLDVV